MTQIEGGHIDDRVGAVPGPDNVNRRVSGPGTEPGSVPGLARLKWAICKRGFTHNHRSTIVTYRPRPSRRRSRVTSSARRELGTAGCGQRLATPRQLSVKPASDYKLNTTELADYRRSRRYSCLV